MSQPVAIADRIIHTVRGIPDCSLEELVNRLSDLSWSEVFLEVDRLRRSGQLLLTQSGVKFTTTLHVR
jgi:hypothetical protein